jgi:histidyl-tRNA synthetase
MTARMWRGLGLHGLELQINTLGTPDTSLRYRAELVADISARLNRLDEDSRRRLERNPLRILDSKNPDMQEVIAGAPVFAEHLDAESASHFDGLKALLDAAGVSYRINPRLVRGLDYYTRTVFEWVTGALGAQGTVCAGGRYDGLVEQFGGHPTPAVGFAMGLERLIALHRLSRPAGSLRPAPDVYVISAGTRAAAAAQTLGERLRDAPAGLRVLVDCSGGSMKSQFKRADRSGAELAVVLGENELEAGTVLLKQLRAGGTQSAVPQSDLLHAVAAALGRGG